MQTLQPVRWAKGKQELEIIRIDYELKKALGERQPLEKKWRDWIEMYRAFSDQPTRNFPFEGASNNVLPIIATDVDQLYANFLTTIHEPQNLWTLSPENENWIQATKPCQDFLTYLDQRLLKMYDVNKRAFLELVKLGTCIYKHGWNYENRPVWTYDKQRQRTKARKIVSHPFVDHVRCFDFIIPTYAYNIQPDHQGGAPWVAERIRMPIDRFVALADAAEPLLPNIQSADVDAIVKHQVTFPTPWDDTVRRLDYFKAGSVTEHFDTSSNPDAVVRGTGSLLLREVELYEVHARAETTEGTFDDIIYWYHVPTRKMLRPIYQPYDHGYRPYEQVKYFPGEGFWGIGVCEQKEVFQKTISDLWNYQVDNSLLANSVMMAAKFGSHIVPGEPIYPGKIFFTDGPVNQEFTSFKLADINQTLPQVIEMMQSWGRERSGVSEINLSNIGSLPSRTPATSVMAMQQEGKKRPDLTMKDMRNSALSVIGLRMLQLAQQYLPYTDLDNGNFMQLTLSALGPHAGQQFAQHLIVPMENAELGIGVELTATSAVANKEVQKQNWMALLQLSGQLYPQFIQLAQVAQQGQAMGSPFISSLALTGINAMSGLFTRLLEANEIRNADQLAPQVPAQVPAAGVQPPAQPFAAPGGFAPNVTRSPGLEGVPTAPATAV